MSEMQKPEPHPEHEWLAKLAGEWTMEGEAQMGPSNPEKFGGTESARMLGELWLLVDGKGEMPGGGSPSTSLMTLGYDPQKQKYVGTFLVSMMTHMWIYEGTREGNVLTLDTVGPGMDGAPAQYRDTIEVISDDHRTMKSEIQGTDGAWTQIMTMHLRRKAS